MKNIIQIDIDTERDNPVHINKPKDLTPEGGIDNMLKTDIRDITISLIYIASLLSEEDENAALKEITERINRRQVELKKRAEETAEGERER
jgi:hypothetical protein